MKPENSDGVWLGLKTLLPDGDLFRAPLREQINFKHSLVQLAKLIDWDRLGMAMSVSFVSPRSAATSNRSGSPGTSGHVGLEYPLPNREGRMLSIATYLTPS
ncbi:hypothetical protein SAMN04487768_0102 [Burkholderia sp. b13]|nr:hypothetical protein SAMN04487768_0102 [Burkholderia sp. b13]